MAGKTIGAGFKIAVDADGRQTLVKKPRRYRSQSDAIAAKKSPKRRYARRTV